MSTTLANPAEMIMHGAPRIIHTESELEEYTAALFRLTALEEPTAAELEAIELLTLLVELYEEEHSRSPLRTPPLSSAFSSRSMGLPSGTLFHSLAPKAPSPCS